MKLAQAILATLKYSDHFNYPLTLAEIHLRLISSEPCSQERVFGTLRSMLKQKRVEQTGEYYHLPRRSSLVARRLRRAGESAPLINRAHLLARQLGGTPGVLAIYLTGSLAMHNASGHADIDLMVITRPNRLWTTRLLLTIYTSLLGLRRTPQSTHNHGKLCLNLYLTPDSYYLPLSKQSLYTAYELIQAVPLYDPRNTRADLLASNPWIPDFLPNVPTGSDPEGSAQPRQEYKKRGGSDPLGIIESICYHLQLAYMRRKITREYVTPHAAFFHPHDPSPKVK